MINYLKSSIKSDSQLMGLHKTIEKNQMREADFGTILSLYLTDYIKKAIESSYQGPFRTDSSCMVANVQN